MKLINRWTLIGCLVAGIVLILISLVFTANFFYSLAGGYLAYCFAIFGVVNDFGKVMFLPAIIYFVSSKKAGHAGYFMILWIVCFSISLVASQAFDLNKKNEIKNKTLIESSSYQRQTELFNTAKESVDAMKSDIASMKASRKSDEQKIITRYATLIETARKLNMLTINKDSVAEITKRRDAEIKELDNAIKAKESLNLAKESSLSEINTNFATVGTNVEHTQGLLAFSQWLSSLFGGNPDKVVGWFYIVKNVFSEFLALGLLLLGGIKLDEQITLNAPKFKETLGFKPNKKTSDLEPVTAKIGFVNPNEKQNEKPKIEDFDEKVKLYMGAMEDEKNKGVCLGYQKISKAIGITNHEASKIKGHLEKIGVLKVIEGQTRIISRNV